MWSRNLIRCCFAIIVSITGGTSGATVYQWVDAGSGITQLSGTPPAWYRSSLPGPRVFVFENGQLVDDTAVAVSLEQRIALRAEAFTGAGERDDRAQTEQRLAAALAAAAAEGIDVQTVAAGVVEAQNPVQEESAIAKVRATADDTLDRLKAIISAWDAQQSAAAKSILERALAPGEP